MGLTCEYDYDPEPGDVCWHFPSGYSVLGGKRGKRCASCGEKIKIGDKCTTWRKYKVPDHDVEIRIYGDSCDDGVPRASSHHCAACGALYFFLDAFKYALRPDEDMRALANEHAEKMKATGKAGCLG